ncbi:MAG TPA: hypothetical protein VGD84_19375 [Pseudonocardiaceae bacterium]
MHGPGKGSINRALRRLVVLAIAVVGLLAASLTSASVARADYTAANLPNWAIGPFTRASQNPLLIPQGNGWESNDVFNPGVLVHNGTFEMLYRGQNASGLSQTGFASSTDGTSFTRFAGNPVIRNTLPNELDSVQDPRLYQLNGTFYTFYTAVHGGTAINEATSTDMIHWNELGPVIQNNKDAAVVTGPDDTPAMINGHFVMYYGQHGNGAFVAFSTDMIHWAGSQPIDMHFPANYSPWEICVTVTNYQTVQGTPANTNIVMFVAGTLMAHGRWFFGISEVEFSSTNLTEQLAQLTDAALSPAAPYELNGQTRNTMFMNSITFHNGQWLMYYGGGDTVIALATAPLRPTRQAPLSSTGFETGQRLPDSVDHVDSGGGQSGDIANVGGFPGFGLTGPETGLRQEITHTGSTALMYSGGAAGTAVDFAYTQAFDTSAAPPTIGPNTTLSYWIFPQGSGTAGVTGSNSSCVALDMVFSDSSALRNSGVTDQNGNRLHPANQCGHLTLDAWNHVTARIGGVAAGKTLARVDLGYDQPGGRGGYRGYVDDISLSG